MKILSTDHFEHILSHILFDHGKFSPKCSAVFFCPDCTTADCLYKKTLMFSSSITGYRASHYNKNSIKVKDFPRTPCIALRAFDLDQTPSKDDGSQNIMVSVNTLLCWANQSSKNFMIFSTCGKSQLYDSDLFFSASCLMSALRFDIGMSYDMMIEEQCLQILAN